MVAVSVLKLRINVQHLFGEGGNVRAVLFRYRHIHHRGNAAVLLGAGFFQKRFGEVETYRGGIAFGLAVVKQPGGDFGILALSRGKI